MNITDRFFRYVKIDTQSDPFSDTFPSTEKQKNLGRLLVQELLDLGVEDAHLDAFGYVYATIPSNTAKTTVPVICFCAHMDTSADCSGADVKPILHSHYKGQDLVLPDDTSIVIKMQEHPDLKAQIGNDIITASGTTLLGADNKAGVAAIMHTVQTWKENPNLRHGKIKILFTPDEEIGRGVDKIDLGKLGAEYAYTIDGETLGAIEDETFSADAAHLIIHGVSAHPGFAKGKMQSALKAMTAFIEGLPKDKISPETTAGKEGFIHPVSFSGTVERAEAHLIIRDFTDEMLLEHAGLIENTVKEALENYPNCTYELHIQPQYRNMKKALDTCPQVVTFGIEAIEKAGLVCKKQSIRGGTDGSRLSFMGLPCPNIFAGEHAFHGKQEWVSVQDMLKSSEVMIHLAEIWEQRS